MPEISLNSNFGSGSEWDTTWTSKLDQLLTGTHNEFGKNRAARAEAREDAREHGAH